MIVRLFVPSFLVFFSVFAQALPDMNADEYLSNIVKDQGQPVFASDVLAATNVCAKIGGRVPSVVDVMIDAYRRETGVRFEGFGVAADRDSLYQPATGYSNGFVQFKVYTDELRWKQYSVSLAYFYGDSYADARVWTDARAIKIQHTIFGGETKSVVPLVATGGSFDFFEPNKKTTVRCVIPKPKSVGTSVLPCREVSPFADVGARCQTSKKSIAKRVQDAETAAFGWQDETDGYIYLDVKEPRGGRHNRSNNEIFSSWDTACKSRSKGKTKVQLPSISELENMHAHGLLEILNERRRLLSTDKGWCGSERPQCYLTFQHGEKATYTDDITTGICVIRPRLAVK